MKAEDFGQLAAQVIRALNANECKPINTNKSYNWQDFTPLTDEESERLDGCDVQCTVYNGGGLVEIKMSMHLDGEVKEKADNARKTLKAKNICLLAVEAKLEAERKLKEADELLTQAAAQLGIPVADVEKIVVTETEEPL